MRWGLIMALLMLQCALPMFSTFADAEAIDGRETSATLIGFSETVVHRNELVEVPFTLHNTGDSEASFTIDAPNIPSDLAVSGLPLTHTLEGGFLKSLKFNLSASATASFGSLEFPVILSVSDSNWSYETNLSVLIAPYSRLDFGVQGVSSFISDAGTRTSVAVNITNNGSYDDDVTFNLYTQSGWNWGWIMNNSDGVNAFETLQPGQLAYVYVWVDVPEVVDGSPLAGNGPRFQLKAVSSVDKAVSQWSFDLLMDTYKNASIDVKGPDLVLDPGANGRVEVDVRNVGNTNNRLSITLQAIDSEGVPIAGAPLDDRISVDGWTMALFNGLEGLELEPNETRSIEIGFQAPGDYTGSMDVRVRVFAEGAPERVRTVDVGAAIEWRRNATVQLQTDECQSLLPNESCTASIYVENTGNARDTFALQLVEVPPEVSATLLVSSVSLNPYESIVLEAVSITASAESLAFTIGEVGVDVKLGGSDSLISTVRVPTKIAPVCLWIFEDIREEVDAKGRLSISMTARNEGNAVDGLLVQLQSSHSTPMSFIPPFIAVYEEGVENPRSYEITDIPIGFNFTIEAWIDLPQDQTSNGTVFVNTTVRSQFAPDEPFVHTSTGSYLGMAWQPVEEESGWFDLGAIFEATMGILGAWMWVILSVLASVLIIQKAITARKERSIEQALFAELNAPKEVGQAEDWMQKFQEKQAPEPEAVVMAVSPQHFQEAFTNRAGAPTAAPEPVRPEVHGAAALALDAQDNLRTIGIADDLLSEITSGNVAQTMGDKTVLPDVEVAPHQTVRHDPKGILGTTKTVEEAPSVPLPQTPSMIDLDDLDV